MRLKHHTLTKLSEITGLGKTYLCDIIATRKRMSYKRARYFEKILEIPHEILLEGNSDELKEIFSNLTVFKRLEM